MIIAAAATWGVLAMLVAAGVLGWVRSVRRDRRRARYLASLAARYTPQLPAAQGEPVTVDQLVARVRRERREEGFAPWPPRAERPVSR